MSFVCHSYFIRMYLHVTRMSFVRPSYVTQTSIAFIVTLYLNIFNTIGNLGQSETPDQGETIYLPSIIYVNQQP